MLEIKNLDIIINTRYLIKNLSFVVNENDKIAIIGEEGNGKTTLLKSIAGICSYAVINGSINTKNNRIGYLPQTLEYDDLNKTVYNFLFINDDDYYNKINRFYKLIAELTINDSLLDLKMINLSGGEKIKIGILKLLLEDFNILLLDEPTNDLDIDSLKWLEKFILNTSNPIIFVSHDELFLSKVANAILHIEQLKRKNEFQYNFIRNSYVDYINNRNSIIKHQRQIAYSEKRNFEKKEEKLHQIMSKVGHQQDTISRNDPFGAAILKRKMKSLKSQEKRMQNTKLTEEPNIEEEIYFDFESSKLPTTKKIIEFNTEYLKLENKILSKNIKLNVIGDEHIVIIGQNGVGKTTLIKEIVKKLMVRQDLKVGYMPQNYDELLDEYKTPLDFLCQNKDKDEITKIRNYLGNINFTSDEMLISISSLSGGSKAKLFFLKFVIDKVQVLILDEPTRNVSFLSNPVIRDKLKKFDGAIISVSHDRKYIDEIATKVYQLTKDGLYEVTKDDILKETS